MRRLLTILVAGVLVMGLILGAAEVAVRWLAPQEPPDMYVADALTGFRLAPNYRGEQIIGTARVPLAFNSWGLRDREYDRRPAGVRIYVLGDSFVFGHGVRLEDTYTKVLERTLQQRLPDRQVEVVNGGVPRFGTLQEMELFEQTVDAVNPDLVLLGLYVGNDVVDNLAFARASDARRRQSGAQEVVDWFRVHSQLYKWMRHHHHAAIERRAVLQRQAMDTHALALSSELQHGFEITEEAIARLASLAHRHGAGFAVILIPSAAQVDPSLWQNVLARYHLPVGRYDAQRADARFVAFARGGGIAVLDLLPGLQLHGDEPLYLTVHWNARGHAIAAAATADFLQQSGLLALPSDGSAPAP